MSLRSILLAAAVLGLTIHAFSQPDTLWTRVCGGPEFDDALGALPLEDGGFFVTGYTESYGAGSRDVWLLRLDENGDTLWTRTYGGADEDIGNSILPAADGNYWLSGRTMSYGAGNRDWFLLKIDENGDSLSYQTFGGPNADWGGRICPTADGGMIITGQWGDDERGAQMGIIKLNADGDSLWGNHFGGPAHEVCTDALQTSDGGYILAGTTQSYALGERDFWLLKTDANGDSLWSHTYGGVLMDYCYGVQTADDGGFALAGYTASYGSGSEDFWLVRTDANGDSLWSRTYGGAAGDRARDLCRTQDGGFVLAGVSWETNTGDAVLIRVDANGDSLWSLVVGTPQHDERNYWIKPLSDGSYFAGGLRLNHPEEQDDLWFMRTGPDPLINEREHFILHPSSFILSVYPNPFNPSTTISFNLPKTMKAQLRIFDITGRVVTTLADEHFTAGIHTVQFDASALSSGTYFARVSASGQSQTVEMQILK